MKVYAVYRIEAYCPALLEAIHATLEGAKKKLKLLTERNPNPPKHDEYGLVEGSEFTIQEIKVGE